MLHLYSQTKHDSLCLKQKRNQSLWVYNNDVGFNFKTLSFLVRFWCGKYLNYPNAYFKPEKFLQVKIVA